MTVRHRGPMPWSSLFSVLLFSVLAVALVGCSDDSNELDTGNDGNDAEDAGEADSTGEADTADDVEGDRTTDVGGDAGPQRCNGFEALCDRRFDEVLLPSTHNSMSNQAEGWVAPNQQFGITRQLEDGVRGLLLDTHYDQDDTYLCHSICLLGSTLLVDGLGELVSFLEANPNEIIAIIFQDAISAEDTELAFQASGLIEWVYTHPDDAVEWPSLRQMIAAGTRVVVTAESGRPPPAWYHHVWDLAFDTPYSFQSVDQFSCELNRGSTDNDLFLVNHFISNPLPNADAAADANRWEVLYTRALACQEQHLRPANFLAVDFYASGDLFEVSAALNGVGDIR